MALRDAPSACPALWRWLRCPSAELRLDLVLASGQAFRWRESSPGAWTGVLGDRVWTLRQERDRLWYTVYGKETPGPETDRILRDYFQLDVGLAALYRTWGAADPLFCQTATAFPGVRVLRQDPVECLLSFICTSNNHVARITTMIERLCQAFGQQLCSLNEKPFHAFPSLAALAGDFFRELWGPYAGWAQAVLFCADLRKDRDSRSQARRGRSQASHGAGCS
ncbi:N-glycosylase/DNA lyase isoform X4 [Tympanuchus pallidicinctus]|uniref:N-glycosylase/DNA lyase isoform X4 n=1 Tax=Tympanuchus pallidicinctus TaxID=109042 RepID=UPI002286DF88|nr:N-glycosylase/DNA lyase isoform X4 [Tympanuchus pallidicinctus]